MMFKNLDPRSLILICIISSTAVLISHTLFTQFLVLLLLIAVILLTQSKQNQLFIILYKMRHLLVTILILQLLFRRGGEVYFAYSFIQITEFGLNYALSALIRYAVIIASSLLLAKIPLNHFMELFAIYHFPRELSLTISFCIQYLSVFSRQIKSITQISKQRNLYHHRSIFKKLMVLKELILPVLIKSMSQVQYKAIALELKGISLKTKVKKTLTMNPKDYAIILTYFTFNIVNFLIF